MRSRPEGFSDALIANQRRYNLESTNNIVNSSGRRVRGFVGIEALVQPDLAPPITGGHDPFYNGSFGRFAAYVRTQQSAFSVRTYAAIDRKRAI